MLAVALLWLLLALSRREHAPKFKPLYHQAMSKRAALPPTRRHLNQHKEKAKQRGTKTRWPDDQHRAAGEGVLSGKFGLCQNV